MPGGLAHILAQHLTAITDCSQCVMPRVRACMLYSDPNTAKGKASGTEDTFPKGHCAFEGAFGTAQDSLAAYSRGLLNHPASSFLPSNCPHSQCLSPLISLFFPGRKRRTNKQKHLFPLLLVLGTQQE